LIAYAISLGTSWGFGRPDSWNFPEFFLRSHPHDAKGNALTQAVFRLSCNKRRPLLLSHNKPNFPRKTTFRARDPDPRPP
jgi:hypothetical protein